jgi:hypothetical protein
VEHATNRRDFMRLGAFAAAGCVGASGAVRAAPDAALSGKLDEVLARPVLRPDLWRAPIPIASIELLKGPADFLVRVRARDGAEGVAAGHPDALQTAWPILIKRVAPFFIGKDARDLESLIEGVYLTDSNYKWQGLPFWVSVAGVEIAILDLLGKVAGKPLGELFGDVVRRDVAVYRASGNRGNSPEVEIAYLQRLVQETGAKAIKFRLGARMRYDEASTLRDLALIALTRKTFGDAMTIYADANGSYDVPTALRIGAIMQEQRLAFLEEPASVPLADRAPGGRRGPARPAVLRWLRTLDPRCAHGRGRGPAMHAAHVRRRPRLSLHRSLRLVRVERRPASGIQGHRRFAARDVRDVVAQERRRRPEGADRAWPRRDHRCRVREAHDAGLLTRESVRCVCGRRSRGVPSTLSPFSPISGLLW